MEQCSCKDFVCLSRFLLNVAPEGDYAVRRLNAQRASDVLSTQRGAIERARQLNNGNPPLVERVRNTDKGHRDKWRKA